MKFILPFLVFFLFHTAHSFDELAYVKTDTPRDTMETFYRAMNDYREGVLNKDSDKMSRIYDAIRCFAESSNNWLLFI